MARYLDIDPNMKGMKFNGLDAGECTALLDAAGIDYVIDGEIGTVTDKIKLSVFVDDRGEPIVAVKPWWLGWKEIHPDTAIWKHERARRPISK